MEHKFSDSDIKRYIEKRMKKYRGYGDSRVLNDIVTDSATLNFILQKVVPEKIMPSEIYLMHPDYYEKTYKSIKNNTMDKGDLVNPTSKLTDRDREIARFLISKYILNKYSVKSKFEHVLYSYFTKVADGELPLEATMIQLYNSL